MKYFKLIILVLLGQTVLAQTKLPVIRATSNKVDIKDGSIFKKGTWNLSPGERPDIFTANRTRQTKWVTFYTDIDSIKVKVKPGTRYNFVILLNGKDSCFTQIASAIPPETMLKSSAATHDTIPFILTAYNAIAIKATINDTDTLTMHFDISSFDFHLVKDAILKKTNLLSNQPDALAGKTAPDYNKLNKVFKLQLGSMIWNDPPVTATNITAHDMDGRIGFTVFEGKAVELDYDHNLLIVHSKLPKGLKGYVRSKIEYGNPSPYIKGSFNIAGKNMEGNFIMDNGSEQALILDNNWAARQNFTEGLKLIRTSTIHDPTGKAYETKYVLAPSFSINTFALSNIPTLVLGVKSPAGFEMNFLGNDVLKRFNMILDLKNDYLYLKPNKLMNVKYRESA